MNSNDVNGNPLPPNPPEGAKKEPTPISLDAFEGALPCGSESPTVTVSIDQVLKTGPQVSAYIDQDFELPEKVKHYKVIREIGAGGMGKVYKCLDTELGRYVALKVLRGALTKDETFVARFKKEALAIAKIRHPNIIQIYSIDTFEDFLFITMEYVEGEGLDTRIQRAGKIPERQAMDLVRQIADGLAHVHRSGILHRDIKPGNILIDSSGRPMVTDFGLAKILFEQILRDVHQEGTHGSAPSSVHTDHGKIMGTPYYLSPECIQGKPADEKSEVYSLGIMMYEMLTGRMPFIDSSVNALFRKHLFDFPPPIAELAPEVSLDVANITYRAIEKRPQNRFPSMSALRDAVASVIQNWRMAGELEERKRLSIEMAKVLAASSRPEGRPRHIRRIVLLALILAVLAGALGLFAKMAWEIGLMQSGAGPGSAWSAGQKSCAMGTVVSVEPSKSPPSGYRTLVEIDDYIRGRRISARITARAHGPSGAAGRLAAGTTVLVTGVVDSDPGGDKYLRVDDARGVRFPPPLLLRESGGDSALSFENLAEGMKVEITGMVVMTETGSGETSGWVLLGSVRDRLVRIVLPPGLKTAGISAGDEVSAAGRIEKGNGKAAFTLRPGKGDQISHFKAE